MTVTKKKIGTFEGEEVFSYVLANTRDLSCVVYSFGATLGSVRMPDKNGKIEEITLGFDTWEEYTKPHPYFGSTVGRFANRISEGRFSIDDTEYQLAKNDNEDHLHGGKRGFNMYPWKAETGGRGSGMEVKLTRKSPHMEEGYPGNLKTTVLIGLNEDNELSFEYFAETDRETPVNLTNHTYWNLRGSGVGTVLDHVLTLNCSRYIPCRGNFIPTGEILPVKNTPFDFTRPKRIGEDFKELNKMGIDGYDHCFVVNHDKNEDLTKTAVLKEPKSGRVMTVYTDKPGVQFYTGNMLSDVKGRGGRTYKKRSGLCLETEHFPDAVNREEFPSPILKPGETYHYKTVHTFSTEKSR
jgi:aldose 1-epimerase